MILIQERKNYCSVLLHFWSPGLGCGGRVGHEFLDSFFLCTSSVDMSEDTWFFFYLKKKSTYICQILKKISFLTMQKKPEGYHQKDNI